MENSLMIIKEQKLNIFQKIRLALMKRNFSMEKYSNAPEYIKNDEVIINKIINNPLLNDKEENLLQIPEEKLLELLESGIGPLVSSFSIEKQIEFISKRPNIAKFYCGDKDYILMKAVEIGNYSVIGNFGTDHQIRLISHLKEVNTLNDDLPNILKHLDSSIIQKILNQRSSLIVYLDQEQQLQYAEKNAECFKYIDTELQLQYMQEHSEYIVHASDETLEKFVLLDINNFQKTSKEFQFRTIARHPKAIEYASNEVKEIIFAPKDEDAPSEALASLLKYDIRNSKYILNMKNFSIYNYLKVFENIQNEDIETIKQLFFHSKLLSAKGKLLSSEKTLHGNCPETASGIDGYVQWQTNIIQKLDIGQISQLIETDNNYILPYLVAKREEDKKAKTELIILEGDEWEKSKNRCIELFKNMYGEEKFSSMSKCIDIIYNIQREKNCFLMEANKLGNGSGFDSESEFDKMRKIEDIPMDQFKIIFNRNIVENNNPEEIQKYLELYERGEENSEELKKLLENAYGPHVKEILESRPDLDVHNINSLEVFDKRIIDNFGEAFVHDLISYNIRDFSGFMEVIKDQNKLETFKTYYNILTKIMGNNVETMQRAISEYCYYEELLENAQNVELTNTQYDNLISVLCSNCNMYNINTLQELQNYEEIVHEYVVNKFQKVEQTSEYFAAKQDTGNSRSCIR